MSKDFFWGLTVRDFERGFWNDINLGIVWFAGAAAAVITHTLVQSLVNQGNSQRQHYSQPAPICSLAAIAAGIAATVYAANHLNHVTFVAEKALKFLVISLVMSMGGGSFFGTPGVIIGLIGMGGVLGYFERAPLYVLGSLGAIVAIRNMNRTTRGPEKGF